MAAHATAVGSRAQGICAAAAAGRPPRYKLSVPWPPRRVWLVFWLLLAGVLVARATTRKEHRGVLIDHVEFGRRLLHGEELYGPWRSDPDAPERPLHAPYPPSFGLLTVPLALLDAGLGRRAARAGWALLQIAALVAIARALRSLPVGPAPPTERAHRWLWLGALLLGSRFVLRDLHGGGGNLINVGLCALAFAAAERERPRAAGWLLGLSLCTKPTQVWLLPLLWLFGRRRAAAHALVAAAACVLASLLLLRSDVEPWLRWLRGSVALLSQADAFAPPALGFPDFEWMNQALRTALARWLGSVPPEFAARVALGVVPGLGLPVAAVAAITRVLSLLLLFVTLVAAARLRADPRARTLLLAATLVLACLLSPLSWKAHFVGVLPALYLLLAHAAATRSRPVWSLLGAFVPCCALGGELLGDDVSELANSLYVVTLAALSLFTALLLLARRPRPETAVVAPVAPVP
jgi:hypothetical protein